MADLRGWSVAVMVVVCIQMAQGCFPPPPRPKPCPGKPSETQNTTEKKPCIFPFLDADGKIEFTKCATLEGYSKENTYCATSLNKDCTYKELGVCVEGGCLLTRSTRGEQETCNKGKVTCGDGTKVNSCNECPANEEGCASKDCKYTDGKCYPVCVVWKDHEVEGTVIKTLPQETLISCITKCSQFGAWGKKCQFWSYDYGTENCILYNSASNKKATTNNHVSGSVGCSQDTGCTIMRNIHIVDTAFNVKFRGVNMEECASKCGENKKCTFWSYKTRTQDCYLKSTKNGDILNIPGFVSGSKGCALKKNSKVSGCVMRRNTYLGGPNIETIKDINTVDDCVSKCGENAWCLFWVYTDKKCILKESIEEEQNKEIGSVSGNKECALKIKTSDCELFSTDTWDKNKKELIKKFVTDDKDDCSKKCGIEPYCDYWIYNTDTSECQLIQDGSKTDNINFNSLKHVIGGKTCALTLQPTTEIFRCFYSGRKGYYSLPPKEWTTRCQTEEKDDNTYTLGNTLPRYTATPNDIPSKLVYLSQKILGLVSTRPCDELNRQTVALALAQVKDRQTKTMKTILYLAGNLENAFNLKDNKKKIINTIKERLDGLFHEVHVINSETKSYQYLDKKKKPSQHHAEMQIGKYIISESVEKDIVVDFIGVSKPPCCACNSVLRKSLLNGSPVTYPLSTKKQKAELETYHQKYNDVIIVSGCGSQQCKNNEGNYVYCGSQYQEKKDKNNNPFWYWQHPVLPWYDFNKGVLKAISIYEEPGPSFQN